MRHKDENKSESIFNAAIQLINENGFSETSMSKIAKKAKVSASTIYVYFENKEDLLNKLYLNAKKKMSEELYSDVDTSVSVQTAYETSLRNFAYYISSNKEDFLFLEQFANSPLLQNESLEETADMFAPLSSMFEKGKKENVFKQVDNGLLEIFTSAPIMQFVKAHLISGSEINEDELNQIIEMSWNAVKA